jgi:hypothetical protein
MKAKLHVEALIKIPSFPTETNLEIFLIELKEVVQRQLDVKIGKYLIVFLSLCSS